MYNICLQICEKYFMRKSNTEHISHILYQLIKAYDWENKLLEIRAIDSWPQIVGEKIAIHTKKLVIVNKVLFVYTDSSIARSELMRIKENIPILINQKLGVKIIDEIVIR